MSRMVNVIEERLRTGPLEKRRVLHLAKGRGDHDWQDVWCGGGIIHPGPRIQAEWQHVCPDCKAAQKEARA